MEYCNILQLAFLLCDNKMSTDLKSMSGACSAHGTEERCVQGFDGEPDGKKPLGRTRRRWEDNIKMDF